MIESKATTEATRHVFEWEVIEYTVHIKNKKHWELERLPVVEHDAMSGKPIGYRVGQFFADTSKRAAEWEEAVDRLLQALAREQLHEALAHATGNEEGSVAWANLRKDRLRATESEESHA